MSEDELRETISRVMRGLNHDLKNPLGAADGYVDLLLQGFRGDLSDEQRQTLERVRALIATGVSILEDIVAYTRAEVGEVRVHASDTDLGATVRMAMPRHTSRAEEAGIALEFGGDASARVRTDGEIVARIVDRLIENALDHAPDGGRVDVQLVREDARVLVRVRDDGPGVSDEERARVFLAFERGRAPARTRQSAGIGIGLPLARVLARRLGGDVLLEDAGAGGGASFALVLPAS